MEGLDTQRQSLISDDGSAYLVLVAVRRKTDISQIHSRQIDIGQIDIHQNDIGRNDIGGQMGRDKEEMLAVSGQQITGPPVEYQAF